MAEEITSKQILRAIWQRIKNSPTITDYENYYSLMTEGVQEGEYPLVKAKERNAEIRKGMYKLLARECVDVADAENGLLLLKKSYIQGARWGSFSDFMYAMEWRRTPKARFWQPRANVLEGKHKIATQIDDFLDDPKAIYLGFSMPPGTGKSTLIKFLLSYIYGMHPESENMYVSYSSAMVKMIYDSVSSFIRDEEYCFNDIFPELAEPNMSAEYFTISARAKGDFPTIGMIGLEGSVTGRTRANYLLVTDDLVKNKEVARSPQRLDTLYEDYKSTLSTRTIGDTVKQIQLGTIWSAHDPISRMKAEHQGDDRYKFIAIPVEDENGESNFEYDCADRYTKERIAILKNDLDSVDFSCLYLQKGMDKEGLAFPPDSLLYYNGILPEGEPDNIIFWGDVAWGGIDSFACPFIYIYGDEWYMHDVLFDRGDKEHTLPRMTAKIINNKAKMGGIEANTGGDMYARELDMLLRKENWSCNITTKRALLKKEYRIEQHQGAIKRIYYRDARNRSREYQAFMDELCSYSFTQKNLHDDAPDSLAGLCDRIFNGQAQVEVVSRRFF